MFLNALAASVPHERGAAGAMAGAGGRTGGRVAAAPATRDIGTVAHDLTEPR